jgi:hypothetical protein
MLSARQCSLKSAFQWNVRGEPQGRDSSGSPSGTAAPEAPAGVGVQQERGYNEVGASGFPGPPQGERATPYGFAQVAVSRAWWRSGGATVRGCQRSSTAAPQALAGDSSSRSLTKTGLALVGSTSGPPKVTGGTLGGR